MVVINWQSRESGNLSLQEEKPLGANHLAPWSWERLRDGREAGGPEGGWRESPERTG